MAAVIEILCTQLVHLILAAIDYWGESTFLRGTVHGLPAKLHVGQDQTAGVNVEGKDWLSEGKLMLLTDYNMEGCLLLVSDEITRSRFPKLPVIGAWWLTSVVLAKQY